MTAPITPDERAEWRALADAATPGPWGVTLYGSGGELAEGVAVTTPDGGYMDFETETCDAKFIAAARTVVPRLLDALDTAEADLDGFASAVSQWKHRALDAEAEVARLRDIRPAPVWDEEVVVAAVARAIAIAGGYDGCFERLDAWADASDEARECGDVEEPLSTDAEDAEFWHSRARAAVAVVRDHLPVRPDRETVERALRDAGLVEVVAVHEGYGAEEVIHEHLRPVVDAVLDAWTGESRATVQAEALRDAAEAARRCWTGGTNLPDPEDPEVAHSFDRWLDARADRLAAEGGADRG